MFWIIVGHIFYYANNGIDNLELILVYADTWILQPLYTVALAVDSYFLVRFVQHQKAFIRHEVESQILLFCLTNFTCFVSLSSSIRSALLLSYLFFQRQKTTKQGNIFIAIAKGIVNRYLRWFLKIKQKRF